MTSEIKVDTISENTSANGVAIDGLTIKDGGITATTGAIVFNEASADLDFRVESNGNANMLFVDGGNDKVGIGTNSLTGTFHVKSTDAGTTMYIEDSHAGDGDGPELYLYRNSASPADNDSIGIVKFLGRNDNSQDVIYGQVKSIILDASDGTEDAKTEFSNMVGGSSFNMLQFDNTGVVINESSNDLDFRVESNDGTHALFVDAGNNVVIVGGIDGSGTTPAPTNAAGGLDPVFQLQGANNANQYSMHISAGIDSAGSPPRLIMSKSRNNTLNGNTILQDDDAVGAITFCAADGTDRNSVVAEIIANVDGTPGGNDTPGRLVFLTTSDGSNSTSERMRIAADGKVSMGFAGTSGSVFHFVRSSGNEEIIHADSTNASYAEDVIAFDCTRAATSSYNLIRGTSGNQADSEIICDGAGRFAVDGTVNPNGADYAEYFEWKDGNSSSEDRVGYSVVLDGNKIVKATDSDDASKIIGVISGKAAVVGDSAWNKWQQKHLKDDYGRYIYEDYTQTEWTIVYEEQEKDDVFHSYQTDLIPDGLEVPDDAIVTSKDEDGNNLQRRKVNPDWNKDTVYIPRSDRKEWDTVGLMGKLKLKKGQPTGTNWIKMRDISDTVEEWLVR